MVATGAYNLIWTRQNFRRTLEKRLRQLRTDYIDVFHFLGVMKPKEFPEPLQEELQRLKEDGRVRAVAMSCHDRKFAGELAARGALDVLMIRYNAAHRGAEQDIFPHLAASQSRRGQLHGHPLELPAPPAPRLAQGRPHPHRRRCATASCSPIRTWMSA